MTPEALWQASDVVLGWSAEAVADLVAQTHTWTLSAGEPLPAHVGLVGVLHGELEMQPRQRLPWTVPCGGVLTAVTMPAKAGPRGAVVAGIAHEVLALMPKIALPRPLPLHPPPTPLVESPVAMEPEAEGDAEAPESAPSLPRPSLLMQWFAPLVAPGPVWRDRLRALRSLAHGRWITVLAALICLQILALGLPLLVKFVIDHTLIANDSPHWPTGMAWVLGATGLTLAVQVATQGVVLTRGQRTDTDLAMARACAAALQAVSTVAYPVVLLYLAPAAAGVLLVGAAAQAWLIYAVAPWQARLAMLHVDAPLAHMGAVLRHADTVVSADAATDVATRLANNAGEDWDRALEQVHRFDATGHIISYVAQALLLGVGSVWVLRQSMSVGTYVAALLMGHHLHASWRALHSRAADLPRQVALPGPAEAQAPLASPSQDVVMELLRVHAPGLHHVDLTLTRRSRTAVIGASGAGKSALAKLAAGMLPTSAGHAGPQDWATHTAYVGPEAPWPPGVLYDSLVLGRDVERPAVVQAVELAAATACIERLPHHLRTRLDGDDPRLCHSERMCLHVAQMLLGGPRLWVIDGALDACPVALADALLTQLAQRLPHTALLVVTRMPTLLQRCRDVLVMHQGSVHTHGTYAQLCAGGAAQAWVEHA